jgi:hypothetical protein
MKTFESKNPQTEDTQKKQPLTQSKTTQPGDASLNAPKDTSYPYNEVQDPGKQVKQPNASHNTQIPNKHPQPQEDPLKKQPQVDPKTPDEKRTDPYANKIQPGKKDQPDQTHNPNDLKEQNNTDAFPGSTAKTRDTSINETTSHKPTNINPSTERNKDKERGIDREHTEK